MDPPRMSIFPSKITGKLPKFWQKVVGCGHAYLLTRKDLLEHVEDAHETLHFKYLRFHGIFSDDVGIVKYADPEEDEVDPDCLNFTNVDVIYDNLLLLGMKPFVELTFMPRFLASGKTETFHYPSNNTPPANYKSWSSLVRHFVGHCVERYGLEEVKSWYFEVWNEPNLRGFWAGNFREYMKLYETTARAIKDVDQDIRVGGPVTADGRWIPEFIDACWNGKISLDFISYHAYPSRQPLHGEIDDYIPGDYVRNLAALVKEQVKRSPMPDLEIHVTEWNSTPNPTHVIHDLPNNAAFICKEVIAVNDLVDSFAYWTVSDIFEELGLPNRAFHGGFGLINMQGIRKPSFHAFHLLNQLGTAICDLELEGFPDGAGAVATLSNDGNELEILAWYYLEPGSGPGDKLEILVDVKKHGFLENKVVDYTIQEISNVYEVWKELGAPPYPTPEQVDMLEDASGLESSEIPPKVEEDEEHFALMMQLTPGGVVFLKIFTDKEEKPIAILEPSAIPSELPTLDLDDILDENEIKGDDIDVDP